MPKVSVIMPVYNSRLYIKDAIDSIINQTYQDWELLVINEYESNDGSCDIVQGYARNDKRIRLIQNDTKIGLAESLNKGIRLSQGQYIARMDADDLSHPTRFEKQVKLMDENSNIGICGTYQHHFGPEIDWIHKPPIFAEECRANLIFDCDLCHSTLMLRKETFTKNNLFYNNNYLAEDFELWTRAVAVADIVNIPEVLGEYRWGLDNITRAKKNKLASENARIVAEALKRNLKMEIPLDKYVLLEGWINPFRAEKNRKKRYDMYKEFQSLLIEIYIKNKEVHFYTEQALLNVIAAKWRNVRYMEPRNVKRNISSIDKIFNKWYLPNYIMMWKYFISSNRSLKVRILKLWKYIN